MADFVAEFTYPTKINKMLNEESTSRSPRRMTGKPPEHDVWQLYVDGSSCSNGSGAGLVLISPEGEKVRYALRLDFLTSNNEAEYEVLIAGLKLAKELQV